MSSERSVAGSSEESSEAGSGVESERVMASSSILFQSPDL